MVSDKEVIYKQFHEMKKDIENNLNILNQKLSIDVYSRKYEYLFFHARSTFETLYAFDSKIIPILEEIVEKTIKIHRGQANFDETKNEMAEKVAEKFLYPFVDRSKESI